MKKMYPISDLSLTRKAWVSLITGLTLLISNHSFALDISYGDMSGSWDTTLSYGISSRVEDRDPDLVGTANAPFNNGEGNARSVNGDDGNLNYDTGVFSNIFKLTSEVEMSYKDMGLFLRGFAFYDIENEEGKRNKKPLTDEALEFVGSDARMLDAYFSYSTQVADSPLELRVGEQVVSWGESTFIQGGINSINPINVAAVRTPSAELREALLPEGMLWGSLGVSENVSVEGFYLYDWDATEPDPSGSYFSTQDFVGKGGERVMLGFGAIPDTLDPAITDPANFPLGAVVQRGDDQYADNDGQYGLALRWFAQQLNDTEFGFYFMNYHSRLPIVSARTGSADGFLGINGANYVSSAEYFFEYPEDIQLFGLSFNTLLGKSGIALQGEISHKKDVPLQIDDVELLFAALGSANSFAPGTNPSLAGLYAFNQVGQFGINSVIPGFIERDVTQLQTTMTKVFGPMIGADRFTLLGEVALNHVHDMPGKDELRLEGPGTFVSGNAQLAAAHFGEVESSSHFADDTSWGYRIVGKLDYNNAIGAVNLFPIFAWSHDVSGISPGPGGSFLENRQSTSLKLRAGYQQKWSGEVGYTAYFGAGRYNLISDRDFVSANIKYAF